MFCLRNYWSPSFALVRETASAGHPLKFNSVVVSLILLCDMRLVILVPARCLILIQLFLFITMIRNKVCGARGPRPRYPRVWKTRKKIGTISKSQKLVESVRFLYVSLFIFLSIVLYSSWISFLFPQSHIQVNIFWFIFCSKISVFCTCRNFSC